MNSRRDIPNLEADVSIPDGYHSITPYFTVVDADKLIAFLEEGFEGNLLVSNRNTAGRIQHARVKIGDSIIMLNEATGEYSVNASQMHLYVENVDATLKKTLEAGADMLMAPNVRPHGDRMAGIKDPCGNIWWIASHTPVSE